MFVAEEDGDHDTGAESVWRVGRDDAREVDCPYRREPVANRNFERAREGDEIVSSELADAFPIDGALDDGERDRGPANRQMPREAVGGFFLRPATELASEGDTFCDELVWREKAMVAA